MKLFKQSRGPDAKGLESGANDEETNLNDLVEEFLRTRNDGIKLRCTEIKTGLARMQDRMVLLKDAF